MQVIPAFNAEVACIDNPKLREHKTHAVLLSCVVKPSSYAIAFKLKKLQLQPMAGQSPSQGRLSDAF
jgi:hypothetical protein